MCLGTESESVWYWAKPKTHTTSSTLVRSTKAQGERFESLVREANTRRYFTRLVCWKNTLLDIMYKQCTLKKGMVFYKAWIPQEFAVRGKLVQIKNSFGNWGSTWEVMSAGQTALSGEYVRELERDHLHQRRASDI